MFPKSVKGGASVRHWRTYWRAATL